MSNPDEIRRDIERTRAELSENVNALSDSAKPANIARSQMDKVKDGVQGIKEKVFGADDDYRDNGVVGDVKDNVGGFVEDAKDNVAGFVGDAKDHVAGFMGDAKDNVAGFMGDAKDNTQAMVQDAPYAIKRNTRGNPLAAGLIAFGLGALAGGLLPATRVEKEKAVELKEQAQPLMDGVKSMAQDAVEEIKPLAQEAVATLKDSAAQAGETIKSEATDAAGMVTDQAKEAAGTVKDEAQNKAEETKDEAKGAVQQ